MIAFILYCEDLEAGFLECASFDEALEAARGFWEPGSIWRTHDGVRETEPVVEFEGIKAAIHAGRGATQDFEFRQ